MVGGSARAAGGASLPENYIREAGQDARGRSRDDEPSVDIRRKGYGKDECSSVNNRDSKRTQKSNRTEDQKEIGESARQKGNLQLKLRS